MDVCTTYVRAPVYADGQQANAEVIVDQFV